MMTRLEKTSVIWLFTLCLSICILLFLPSASRGQQQFRGVCARVKIEILQELTLERIGFLATLEITNNESEAPITDFSATLTFENPELSEEDSPDDASPLFFVQPPDLEGIGAIDGTGTISPTKTAVIQWFIIPKIAAGGTEASGVRYRVGANLAGKIFGNEIDPEILKVIPDVITVKPEPQLDIIYFQPRDVAGDDPFTVDVVESPIPFILGVLVRNVGYGIARNVKIASQQPRIVENREGLLLIAQLLGARVDDEQLDEASLTVNLGDIEPAGCRKGAWDMITSLSGEFVEFKASFTHSSELGGEETSVITSMNAYFIAHEVLNDQPGRDGMLDFLADTDNDPDMLPDSLYESECNLLPVNHLINVAVREYIDYTATVWADADREGWVYMRTDDPGQAKYPIASITRSDGKLLSPHNYWTNIRYERGTNKKLTYLNIFDFVALGEYEYSVVYTQPPIDTNAPVTHMRFSGPVEESSGVYYILPQTQIYFTVVDDSVVATYYRLDDETGFVPAYPFTISEEGGHTIEYYSIDIAGNEEAHKTATLMVSVYYPGIQFFTSDFDQIFLSGSSLSVRPTSLGISFQCEAAPFTQNADIDIFKGVLECVALSEIPSSTLMWTVDTNYGCDFSGLEMVRHIEFKDVGPSMISYEWDSKDDQGAFLPAGWYTMRLTLKDELGRSACAVKIVRLAETMGYDTIIPDPGNAARKNVHACGRWAVWQGQQSGNWDIYAMDLLDEGASPVSVTDNPLNQENPKTDGHYAVWEDRQMDGSWDIWAKDLESEGPVFPVTETSDYNEKNPAVFWPWIVYQSKPVADPDAPWQLMAYNMVTHDTQRVDQTTQDQRDPSIYEDMVVWQDFRDSGWGEIYLKDLKTSGVTRITDDTESQYYPVISGKWIIWSDKRNTQNELYGYNLLRKAQVRLTNTPEDETLPYINGKWVVYLEDSAGVLKNNLSILNLSNLTSIQLTNFDSEKSNPCLASGKLVWEDSRNGISQIMTGNLPNLQPVFNNQNILAVTQGMVSYQKDAYTLLATWNKQAGVTAITRYTALVPHPVSETVIWENGHPAGENFALEAGSFLWAKFGSANILELGEGTCDPVDLASGVNVFSYWCFPDNYTAYKLIQETGRDAIKAIRILDSETGKWLAASVENNRIIGENFAIPRIAVLMMDMKTEINQWKPGE